jgi:hypothetical protein
MAPAAHHLHVDVLLTQLPSVRAMTQHILSHAKPNPNQTYLHHGHHMALAARHLHVDVLLTQPPSVP